MSDFYFEKMDISDAWIIHSFYSEDHRGSFIKSFEKDIFRSNGIEFHCNEDFISHSTRNVIRGMHFQLHNPQAKIVGVISGVVYDVLVDLRKDSPTYGQWRGVYLSADNKTCLLIPRGCAHGFISLSDDSVVSYKCDGSFDRETDTGVLYCDATLNIQWPIDDLANAILSERDKNQMTFAEFDAKYDFTFD